MVWHILSVLPCATQFDEQTYMLPVMSCGSLMVLGLHVYLVISAALSHCGRAAHDGAGM